MNSSKAASTESATTGQKKKRRYLSAEKKFQIYLETQRPDQPVGEILRREGMFSTDLARIRQQVREGALLRLGAKPGRKVELVSTEAYAKLKLELEEKERAMADQAVELAILRKKNEWGFVGPIADTWLPAVTKQAILLVIATSQDQGVSARRSCAIMVISHRRVVRWQAHERQGLSLADGTPGPQEALHRLRPEEIERIAAMAQSEEYVDLSHRILAITAGGKGLFFASFSTVYRILKARDLMTTRGPGGRHNGHSLVPVRKAPTGPNQRWCWDISYLLTEEKGVYLFLYLLLDEFSREAIHWQIGWTQTATAGRLLLEGGLEKENILDLPEDQRPELLNDRGRQMKAKPIRRLCEDHHMPQLFARPRTPNNNPFIESAFSTVKRAPEYPGRFLDDGAASTYFARYFDWYNHEHYHSGIAYVTPHEAYTGLRAEILARRLSQQRAQCLQRRLVNQQSSRQKPQNHNPSATSLVVQLPGL